MRFSSRRATVSIIELSTSGFFGCVGFGLVRNNGYRALDSKAHQGFKRSEAPMHEGAWIYVRTAFGFRCCAL